jgi:hypothetical protein
MKQMIKIATLAMTLTLTVSGAALATPSTQIWIPSTDIQPFGTVHLNIDNYFRSSGVGKASGDPAKRDANVMDIGPTVGVLPFEKIQAEVGFDYYVLASDPNDNHPFSFNAKIGTPEDAFFKYQPAVAVGIYNLGPGHTGSTLGVSNPALITSGQNIIYALAARTLPAIGPVPSLGRISAGYYRGAKTALVDANNMLKGANDGLLLSWDRTMTEISDKLWLGVDYMSGNNVDGAVSFGVAWNFAKNVAVIFGYNVYKEKSLAGNNTFTTQLDINIP